MDGEGADRCGLVDNGGQATLAVTRYRLADPRRQPEILAGHFTETENPRMISSTSGAWASAWFARVVTVNWTR